MPSAPKPPDETKPDRRAAAVRLMALFSAALAVMCVWLAMAWKTEREAAACWRIAAEFQQTPEGGCEN